MAAQVETTSQPGGGAGGSAGNPSEIHTDVNSGDNASGEEIEKTRTLICALNFLSRNLPLPQDVFDAVSSIYHDGTTADTAADEENNHVDDDKNEEEEATERGADNQNDDANVVGGGGVGSSAVAAERAAAQVSNFLV